MIEFPLTPERKLELGIKMSAEQAIENIKREVPELSEEDAKKMLSNIEMICKECVK